MKNVVVIVKRLTTADRHLAGLSLRAFLYKITKDGLMMFEKSEMEAKIYTDLKLVRTVFSFQFSVFSFQLGKRLLKTEN